VRHPRWSVWAAEGPALEADVAGLYGSPLAEALAAAPRSAFVADGSVVSVHRGTRIA
jgi:hypothetical protein